MAANKGEKEKDLEEEEYKKLIDSVEWPDAIDDSVWDTPLE